MTHDLTRRGFIAASAAMAATTVLPRFAFAQSAPLSLTASTRVLEIDGKAATVYGLVNGAALANCRAMDRVVTMLHCAYLRRRCKEPTEALR